MVGIYFSGTGNSRYCVESFLLALDGTAQAFSLESDEAADMIRLHDDIVFGYPVQYSNIPRILRDFVVEHQDLWNGKRIFCIATMGLFSGDGAGLLARLLERHGAVVIGGLHLKMPDSICDEKALKRPLEVNRKLVADARAKIKRAATALLAGAPPQEGLGVIFHLAGLFGQRLYFFSKTRRYSDKLKIHAEACVGCGTCVKLCPMKNLALEDGVAVPGGRCTMCYRCIAACPKQAITLLGKRVVEQTGIEKYL